MARIAGVELDETSSVDYALTKIKGVGWALSNKILSSQKIDKAKKVSELSTNEISKITSSLEDYLTEGDLTRVVRNNISRLQTIGAYRGLRHQKGLPVRGQRTRSNARTKRGKRKTIGAFKKEMLGKTKQQAKVEDKKGK